MSQDLIFYDIEVFEHNNLVVFKDIDNNTLGAWWDDVENRPTLIASLIKDKTLIGYNNYNYDDYILTLMIRGIPTSTIKYNNDMIINGTKTGIKIDELINSIDCFQQIDLSRPSLKKIEGNMGFMIKESDVPFNLPRPLTNNEKDEVLKYCSYDVESTIRVYKLREHNYFEAKNRLLELMGNPKAIKWNTTTISANLLLPKPLPKWSTLRIPEHLWRNNFIPEEVWDLWEQVKDYTSEEAEKKSKTILAFDNNIQFGFGGLHGANINKGRFENVKLLDVTSLYPSIIINLNILDYATKTYSDLKDKRVAVKHTDKSLSDALKLVLNSVYGNLKNKYSLLYNPKASMTVCIYGQIVLYKLCSMLYEQGCTIVNINTDGVAFVDNGVDIKPIQKSWEEEFNLQLEEDDFELWIQRDVNNYISVQGDSIKVKGGDCAKYQTNKYFGNNNARILDIALVDYLIKGTPVIDTLMLNMENPLLYQYILQSGRTYEGVFDEDGNKYNKTNRIFACKPSYANKKLFKKRADGGLVNFADVPDYMKLWDGDVNDIDDFKKWIDLNHYYQIVTKRLKAWEREMICI